MITVEDAFKELGLEGVPQRVLVVEDHLPLLEGLRNYLATRGHTVITLTGIIEVEGTIAKGSNATGQLESVDLWKIDTIFLDYQFESITYNGGSFARVLNQKSMGRVVAMSSSPASNAAMVREGAVFALRKNDLISFLEAF